MVEDVAGEGGRGEQGEQFAGTDMTEAGGGGGGGKRRTGWVAGGQAGWLVD